MACVFRLVGFSFRPSACAAMGPDEFSSSWLLFKDKKRCGKRECCAKERCPQELVSRNRSAVDEC
jgi:hypothetical protein